MIHAHTKDIGAVRNTEVDVGHSLGVRAGVDGVFLVVHKGVTIQVLPVDGVEEGVDGPLPWPEMGMVRLPSQQRVPEKETAEVSFW